MTEEEYSPITKESLMEAVLKLYFHTDIGVQTTVEQLKKIDEDTRIKWEKDLPTITKRI